MIDVTIAMSLATLHENVRTLRSVSLHPRNTSRDACPTRGNHVPGRKQRNNNASFQFSNQDQQITDDGDELDDSEMDYMMPFFDDEVLNI